MARNPNRRRLSFLRLLAVIAVLAAVVWGGQRLVNRAWRTLNDDSGSTWFGPYVDVTLTPLYHFEDPLENPSSTAVLSFIVADPDDACSPSWGGFYSLDEASRSLDFDRRLARYRERGGSVVLSFGGLLNDELAIACTDVDALEQAYEGVIKRYGVSVLDFDLEGTALTNGEANARRAVALSNLQKRIKPLDVWLTLPVGADEGLKAEGVATLDATLAGGVKLAGVNAMTMNYGGSRGSDQSMHAANVSALNFTHKQVRRSFAAAGVSLSSQGAWRRLGATPMIGQNDVIEDQMTVKDAERLRVFAVERGMGRLSMWSANRDVKCGAQLDSERVSNSCSGVEQRDNQFAFEFDVVDGALPAEKLAPSIEVATRQDGMRDNAETSPYPVWRTSRTYELGDKVVWHQGVYEAKWWNTSDAPDRPVENLWDTPWRYLGPVLRGEKRPELPVGLDIDAWDETVVYSVGDRVVYEGQAYEAKFQNADFKPDPDPDTPSDNPWELLDPTEF